MRKKYLARLAEEERQQCEEVVDKLKGTSQKSSERTFSSKQMSMVRLGPTSKLQTLDNEIGVWLIDVTSTQRSVDWQMKINDARCKLTSIYPKIQC